MRRLALVGFTLMAASVSVSAAKGELSPRPLEQTKGIHVCYFPEFVVGIHVQDNVFYCSDKLQIVHPAEDVIDGDDEPPTACTYPDENGKPVTLHCCPPGMAVRGVHVGKNLLVCSKYDQQAAEQTAGKRGLVIQIDHRTQRYYDGIGLHACPDGFPMLGFHEGRNLLLCLTLGPE